MFNEKIDNISFWIIAATGIAMPVLFTTATADIFGVPKVTWLRLAAMTLLALMALRVAASGQVRLPSGPLAVVALAFITIVGISAILSVHVPTSIIGLRKRFFGFSTYLPLLIILVSAASLKWDYSRLRRFAWAIAAGGGLTSLIGIAQRLGAAWPVDFTATFGSNAFSTIGNPNFFGIYLAMSLPIAIALIAAEPSRQLKGLASAIAALIVAAALATGSSGALLGLTGGIIAYLALARPGPLRNPKIIAAVLALFLLVSMAGLFFVLKSETQSRQSRSVAWQAAGRLIAKNPWFGTGPDTGRFTIEKAIPDASGFHGREVFEDTHNILLTTAATSGLPAAALFMCLAALGVTGAVQAARKTGGPAGTLLCGTASAIVGYGAAEMVNPDNLVPLGLFWLCLGVIAGRRWSYRERPVAVSVALPVALIAGSAAVLGAAAAIYAPIAEVHLLRAEQAQSIEPMLAEYLAAESANPYYDWYSIRIADKLTPFVSKSRPTETALALAAVDRAIAKSPLETDNYVIKGTIYRILLKEGGDPNFSDQALKMYKKALQLNPRNLAAIRDIAETYFLIGDRPEAKRWLDRYLVIDKDPEIEALKTSW